jgi:hypothetical protein
LEHVNVPQTEEELARLRRSAARGVPFGDAAWQRQTAAALGLESSMRDSGRPAKKHRPAHDLPGQRCSPRNKTHDVPVAVSYEKLTETSEAMIMISAIHMMVKRLAPSNNQAAFA